MENILAIILCRKFIISILSELDSVTLKKNVECLLYASHGGNSSEQNGKKIPVFTEFIIWWGDR